MSSDSVPEGRCGFVLEPGDLPEDVATDFEAGSDDWYEFSDATCCWRSVWDGANDDRCVWHAETDDKPAAVVTQARADHPERLEGAFVPAIELGDTVDFDGCWLWATTFEGTNLRGASFRDADARHAHFPGANLAEAEFSKADLAGAQFPDTILWETRFLEADLRNAHFPDADLSHAEFNDAFLVNARFPAAALIGAQFSTASLTGARFPQAGLPDARFPAANLRHAEFPEAYLGDARFPAANLFEAQFSEANLSGAQFPEAFLMEAEMRNADLSSTQFPNADLSEADLSEASLTAAMFTGAILDDATITGADLGDADLTDARFHDAHLLDARINDGTEFGSVVPEEADADWFAAADLSLFDRLRWWLAWWRTDGAGSEHHERLNDAATVYRTIQRLYRENSMPRRIDTYYVRARDTRRKQAIIDGDLPRWLYLAAQRWVMGYGERPWRVVATSGLVILGCAVAYPLVGGVTETSTGGGTPHYVAVPLPDVLPSWVGLPGVVETVLTSLYFSVVTFTTLGYGDLRPRTGAAQFLATFESLVGAFLLALLVYVLGRRATR